MFQFFDKAHGLEVLVKGGSLPIRSFPTGVKVTSRSRGQGDILGVVKQSTCNYLAKLLKKHDNCAFAHA